MFDIIILFIVVSFFLIFILLARRPYYKGPKSDHFDGTQFSNVPNRDRTFKQFLKWMLNRNATPWPESVPLEYEAKPMGRTAENEMIVTFVNHSTVLVQWDGLNILTDPVWYERVSPFKNFGPKRKHPPGIAFENLPTIDIVLLSHNHYDHLDIGTLSKLFEKYQPKIITGLGNKLLLSKKGIQNVTELDWWQGCHPFPDLSVTYVPAQHFSARWPWDKNKALWGGFVVQGRSGSLYFAGDSGEGDHFKQIREKLGSPRLALIPIGAYEPRWFMKSAHLSPEDAIKVHLDLGARTSLAIHHGTFRLADEGIDEPPKALKRGLAANEISEDIFWVLKPGASRTVP